jgi:YD repeat-containing protein
MGTDSRGSVRSGFRPDARANLLSHIVSQGCWVYGQGTVSTDDRPKDPGRCRRPVPPRHLDDANRRTSLTLPNGLVTEYSYDAASRLTGLTYKNGSTVLGTLTYSYDAAGLTRGVA